MAIIGRLPDISKHFKDMEQFQKAFEYFEKALDTNHEIHQRIQDLPMDAFEKVDLGNGIFALEQKFISKERSDCFLESHIKYIDIQLIVTGEELMECCDIHKCKVLTKYDKDKDLITYEDFNEMNKIRLQPGDFAIYFPQDIHLGCQRVGSPIECTKTVIKMPIEFFN